MKAISDWFRGFSVAGLVLATLAFAFCYHYYKDRYTLACEYISNQPNVAEDLKGLVRTDEGCMVFVKSQRGRK